jgi:hypothetical protein
LEANRRTRQDDRTYEEEMMMNAMDIIIFFSLIMMFGVFIYHWIHYYLDFHSIDMYIDDDSELHEGELL